MTKEVEAITRKEVARAIGWLDAMCDSDELRFDSADWSRADEDGVVHLEGRKGDLIVTVTVQIVEVDVEQDWDDSWLLDDEDDEDNEDGAA